MKTVSTRLNEQEPNVQTKDCIVKFRNYGVYHLPPGLRVTRRGDTYFLDEFPEWMFKRNSMQRHDAIHYGVVLTRDQIEGGD